MNNPSFDREDLVYRQSTLAVVTNKKKEILLIQKQVYRDDQWHFPGGGIEDGENKKAALIRELEEELGNKKFKIISQSKKIHQYEFPDEMIEKRIQEKGSSYRGQQVAQFLVEFEGEDKDLIIESEIRLWMWVHPNLIKQYLVFPQQWDNAKEILEEFNLYHEDKYQN